MGERREMSDRARARKEEEEEKWGVENGSVLVNRKGKIISELFLSSSSSRSLSLAQIGKYRFYLFFSPL